MIRLLDNQERGQLRDIYRDEFESETPDERQANVIAIEEDGEIVAFVTAELLIRAGMVWVDPKYRGTAKASSMLKSLAHYIEDNAPKGSSVITIDSGGFETMFSRLGMRKIDGTVYRKDL